MFNILINNSLSSKKEFSENPYKTCSIKRKYDVCSRPLEAEIYKTTSKDSFEKYEMKREGKIIGEIELENNKDSVFIVNLESYGRHKYKGIGTNLMSVAVERSLDKNNNGTVTLNAQPLHKLQNNPVKFYKKMGFEQLPSSQYDTAAYGQPMKLIVRNNSFWMNKVKEKTE